ncbi:MAG: MMPL family transporter, partial [Hyphomicrobiaceae bacterium]|nr:MMPL family transporter [Hyphomicrobiaceae bacterium]
MNHHKNSEKAIASQRAGIRLPLAFEYPGVLAVNNPIVTLILVFLLSIFLGRFIVELEVENSLSNVFNSNSAAYQELAQLKQSFPQSDDIITLAVTANSFEDLKTLEDMRDIYYEITLLEGVADTFSIFNIHERYKPGYITKPLIPEILPVSADISKIMGEVRKHPLVQGRLFTKSNDGKKEITLIIISPDQRFSLEKIVYDIRNIVTNFEKARGLRLGLTGTPVITAELAYQSSRDRVLFLSLGLVVGSIVCFLFFRRFDFLIIANVPAFFCLYWSLCTFGAIGIKINPIMTAVLPLLMVITYTNAMHILFVLRKQLLDNCAIVSAALIAVRAVGPACFISALTTILAFISIAQTDAEIIRTFGFAAAVGTMLSYLSAIIVVPALAVVLLCPKESSLKESFIENAGILMLDKIANYLASFVVVRARAISAVSLFFLGVAIYLHASLTPQYRLSDMVPTDGEAKIVAEDLADTMGGTNPVYVMLFWKGDKDFRNSFLQILPAITEADAILRNNHLIHGAWSLETLKPFLVDSNKARKVESGVSTSFLDAVLALPERAVMRFINIKNNVTLLTGFTGDLEAKDFVALKRILEAKLSTISQRYAGVSFFVTGQAVLSAQGSLSVINKLYISLILAIGIVTTVIIISFRSLSLGIISLVPNLFSVTATGSALYVLGWQLEYAGI